MRLLQRDRTTGSPLSSNTVVQWPLRGEHWSGQRRTVRLLDETVDPDQGWVETKEDD
jgi:hypothetical protein